MILPRVIFAVTFACLVTQVRFTSLLFRNFSMDDQQIGLVLGIGLLFGAILVPTWSRVADLRGARYSFTPLVEIISRVWFTMFGRVLGMIFAQPLSPIADAYALRRLGGKREMYGRERAWGSLSWGLSAIIVGGLMTYLDYMLAYGLFVSILSMVSLICLHYAPNDLTEISETAYSKPTEKIEPDFVIEEQPVEINQEDDLNYQGKKNQIPTSDEQEIQMLKEKAKISVYRFLTSAELRTIVFLIVMLILEMGQSLTDSLEFLFIVEELKSSPFLCGVSVGFAVILEVPLLYVSEPLLRRLGILVLMLSGIVVFCIRVISFTYITSTNPWIILSVEPLAGIYVAFIKMSSVSFMSKVAPKGQEATAMGTLNVFRCLGQVFGAIIGSYILEKFGSTVLYQSFGVLIFLAGLVLIWVFRTKHEIVGGVDEINPKTSEMEDTKRVRTNSKTSTVIEEDVVKSEIALLELQKPTV